jgi:hypothetical protein
MYRHQADNVRLLKFSLGVGFERVFIFSVTLDTRKNERQMSVSIIRLLNSRTVSVKFCIFLWSVPMVRYLFSCLYTKSSYKNVKKKSLVMLRVPITQRKYLFRNYTTNHTTPADRFTTGTTMEC